MRVGHRSVRCRVPSPLAERAFAPGLVRAIQYAATATGVANSLGAAFGGRLPVA
jgi:hypothetical protein